MAATSTTLNGSPLGTDSITCELLIEVGAEYILAARKKIGITIKPKYTWLGLNTNWNDPINWCPSVPGSTTDVNIPSVASNIYPIFDNYTGSVRNITIASNASVIVNGTGVLQIAGTINNNGTFNTTSGSLVFNGTSAQTISGNDFSSKTLKNLTVSNNAGLSVSAPPKDTLNITGTLSFGTNSATLYTGNNITLKSTASGTARVGQLAPGNIITGDVIVERHISLGRKWRLLSVPTNGIQTFKQAWQEGATTVNPNPNPGFGILIGHPNNTTYEGLGFDIFAPGGSTLKTYNSTTDAWVGISTTNNPISTLGGYMTFIVGNRSTPVTPLTNTSSTTIRTIGNLKQQQQEVTIPMNKYAVVGNPYASPVALARINRTNVQNSFVVWDPKLTGPTSAYGLGAFQYLTSEPDDCTTYTATPGGGSYPDDLSPVTSIESGLAFFMKAESTGNGTVTFHEATKSTGENISVFKTENTIAYKRLVARLYAAPASGTGIVDAVVARFGEAYSNAYNDEDILKIANTGENLSIENNNKSLVIDNRNSLNANDTIHLKLSGVRVQNYIWKLDLKNMAETGLEAFLLDKYLQVSTPLLMTGQTLINFSIANIPGSYAPDRFKIVFKTAVLLPVNITSISANRNNDKTVSVLWKVQQELNLTGYEVQRSLDGSSFVSIITQSPEHNNGGAISYQAVDRGVAEGDLYYRIKANSISGQVQYSAIVKVAALKQNSSISVYPNPVVGGQVHLRFIAQPVGRYQVQLTNAVGQMIYNAAIEVSNALQSENIPLPLKTAGGQYQLRVIKPDGKVYTQQVFVE